MANPRRRRRGVRGAKGRDAEGVEGGEWGGGTPLPSRLDSLGEHRSSSSSSLTRSQPIIGAAEIRSMQEISRLFLAWT